MGPLVECGVDPRVLEVDTLVVLPRPGRLTIAREIWTASAQRAPDGSWREVSAAPVKAWWTVWVCALVTLRLGTQWQNHAEQPQAFQHATDVVILADGLLLTAAVLAIVFVRKLTAMQHTKATYGPLAAV